MHYDGAGLTRDRRTAAGYFERACDRGQARGCAKLGHQYRWAIGVGIDWIRSYRLFKRACDLGDKNSCAQVLDLAKLAGLR